MATKSAPPSKFRLLLDQGFPNPPGFRPESVDKNLTVEHLSAWNPALSESSTPDWVVYCEAAFAGFNALVTRDFTQSQQAAEMVTLSRLKDFHVISWKNRMDDPVTEWGQVIAYLPLIRRFIGEHDSRIIFLPTPSLAPNKNVHSPKEFIAAIAENQGTSVNDVRLSARSEMEEWEAHVANRPFAYTGSLWRR